MTSKEYVDNVRNFLLEKHGEVKPSWEGLLTMLGCEYDLFLTAQSEVYANGMVTTSARGLTQSPYVKIMTDASIQVQKILNDLGANPKMLVKVKSEEKDNENDFLDNLTKGYGE